MSWWDDITGTISDETYANLPQVSGVNRADYQIQGLPDYLASLAGMQGQPGIQLNTANADQMRTQQMANIGQLQGRAAGTVPSPAQVFLQNQQQGAMRNLQAQALSQQAGNSPGLAFRGLMNAQGALQAQAAAQGALMQQQDQQQAQLALAQQLAGVRSQDLGQAGAVAVQEHQNRQFQQGLVNNQFQMANAQTGNNIAAGQDQRQLDMYNRNQQLLRAQQQAQQAQMPWKLGATALGTGAGFMLSGGNPMGAALGAQLGGSLFGGGGMDPQLLLALSQTPGGGRDPNDPNNPYGLGRTNGVAPGMYRDPYLTGTGQGSF